VINRVKEGEILLKNQVQEQWILFWWGEIFNYLEGFCKINLFLGSAKI
jgi:hypothetical protein